MVRVRGKIVKIVEKKRIKIINQKTIKMSK